MYHSLMKFNIQDIEPAKVIQKFCLLNKTICSFFFKFCMMIYMADKKHSHASW